MFGLLKSKISGFVNNLIGREEKKEGEPKASEAKVEEVSQAKIEEKPTLRVEEKAVSPPAQALGGRIEPKPEEKKVEIKIEEKKIEIPISKPIEQKVAEPSKIIEEKKVEPKIEEKKVEIPVSKPVEQKPAHVEPKIEKKAEPVKIAEEKKVERKIEIPVSKPTPTPVVEVKEKIIIEKKATPEQHVKHEVKEEKKHVAPTHAPAVEVKQEAEIKQKHEEKKGIFGSIWPFGKKEEKAAEPKVEAAPIIEQKKPEPKPVEKKIEIPQPNFEHKAPESAKPAAPELKKAEPIAQAKASEPKPVAPEQKKAEPHAQAKAPEPKAIAHDVKQAIAEAKKEDIILSEQDLLRLEKKALSDDEREMKVKVGVGKSITSIFSQTITISQSDVQDLIDELELSLLESDVAYEVSLEVSNKLKTQLVGMKIQKDKMQERVHALIEQALVDVMTSKGAFSFDEKVRSLAKPVKIIFIGPNGAGKTTTMAKIAKRLMNSGLKVMFSASDTFRAAAIEQAEVHANRLGIPVIKSGYGADPAAVAFDAIKYAKAHNIDVVLIDSAGRQDTNANLIDELKKINRVINPDLKIYIGESISGNALLEQVSGFHKAVGIDGAILTKLDCDAKGGTAISLAHATGVPILFLGVGQKYEDLVVFDAADVAKQILGSEAS